MYQIIGRLYAIAITLGAMASLASAQHSFVYSNDHFGFFPSLINAVSAFSVDTDGVFKEIPGSPFSTGALSSGDYLDDGDILVVGNHLYVANKGGAPSLPGITVGSVSVFSINAATGFLTPITGSPFLIFNMPAATTLAATPDGRFLYLGDTFFLNPIITIFHIAVDGSIAPIAGQSVRVPERIQNMKVSPDGKFLAVSAGVGVYMYAIDSEGLLTPVGGSPFFHASSPFRFRSLEMNCESTHLYAIRWFGPIEVYEILATGALSYQSSAPSVPGFGGNPVFGILSPNGQLFFVSDFSVSRSIASFTVAPDGSLGIVPGSPFSIGLSGITDESVPGGLAINQAGTILYSSLRRNLIGAYSISTNGALTPVPGTAVAATGLGIPEIYTLAAFPGRSCEKIPDFDNCIKDDSNGNRLEFNSITGDYRFGNCSTLSLTGTASIIRKGGIITLQHNAPDRRILASIDSSVRKGTATIRIFPQGLLLSIIDRDTANNNCACPHGS